MKIEQTRITFDELIEYGEENGGNMVNGFPWSFDYEGHPITHENDECYLVIVQNETVKFTPADLLVLDSGVLSIDKGGFDGGDALDAYAGIRDFPTADNN